MKNLFKISILFTITILLSSCATTFAGSLFVITIRDAFFYGLFAIVMAFFMAISIVKPTNAKFLGISMSDKGIFLSCFLINFLLSPLFGIIFLIIKYLFVGNGEKSK